MLDQFWVGYALEAIALQRLFDGGCELCLVGAEQGGRLSVQGIIRVGLVEQETQPVNDLVDIHHWPPLVSQNIQAHCSLCIDIWVINLCLAHNLRGLVWVVSRDREIEHKATSRPIALRRLDNYVEISQVVRIREFCVLLSN